MHECCEYMQSACCEFYEYVACEQLVTILFHLYFIQETQVYSSHQLLLCQHPALDKATFL